MSWIFDTYSSVYNTAMMQDVKHAAPVQAARKAKTVSAFARLFHRHS